MEKKHAAKSHRPISAVLRKQQYRSKQRGLYPTCVTLQVTQDIVPPCSSPCEVTVDLFGPLWWVANENEACQTLNYTRITILKGSSGNLRFPKDENTCICSSGVPTFKFRGAFESDVEIRELCSVEWRSLSFDAWSECPTFASHYTN